MWSYLVNFPDFNCLLGIIVLHACPRKTHFMKMFIKKKKRVYLQTQIKAIFENNELKCVIKMFF